ncbi:MAG TPA: acyltransferase [Isosphaeraceae bacterium]|jgi:peptidoglycan/LPS O-acetylase OafA/YrhL|nr:acyltransferase [Isosphaeraceae bacterium]
MARRRIAWIRRRDEGAPAGGGDGDGRRVPELDALRGLACLLIVLYHFKPHKLPGGWAAVDLFFVLSGYLITAIILKYSDVRILKNFYVRRGLRIWPLYYLTVLLVAAASPLLPRPCDFRGLAAALSYTQNASYYWSAAPTSLSAYLEHTWSLAIEEQFYLLWPPLVCLVGRRGVVPLSLATVAVSAWARARGYHWWLLLARADGLALGALLAALVPDAARPDRRPRWLRPVLAVVGPVALAYFVAVAVSGGMPVVGPPRWPALTVLAVNLAAVSAVGLALCHQGRPSSRFLRRRWLVYLGTISYGVYMFHYLVITLGNDVADSLGKTGRPFWRDVLFGTIIFAMAAVSWRYFERPILALKGRFGYGPAAASPTLRGPHRAGKAREVV